MCVLRYLVVITFLSAAVATPALAGVVVVPNFLAASEGNQNSSFPFNIGDFGLISQRYQQIYASSQFPFGGDILQIMFRPDARTGAAFSGTLPNVQIALSTTSTVPDALSTTFANNVGPDNRIVYSGPLSLFSTFAGPANGPKGFDIVVDLMTPFSYNPLSGNLLLDVRNLSDGTTIPFDAQAVLGDSVSRVFSTGAATAMGTADTLGLVTKFNIIPEPGTLAASLCGLGVFLCRGWLKCKR